MNMIEKMATAMRGADRIDPVDQDYYIALARAALQAIREPDANAIQAGMTANGFPWGVAHSTFTAMIDHILSEGEGK